MAKLKKDKGTLIVKKGKRGFYAKFRTEHGKELPISSYRPGDDQHDGVKATLHRDGGNAVKLVTEDGLVLMDLLETSQEKSEHKNPGRSGSVGKKLNFDNTLLPERTQKLLKRYGKIDNFSIQLNKAAKYDSKEGKFYLFKSEKKINEPFVVPDFKKIISFEAIEKRNQAAIRRLGYTDSQLATFQSEANWRWVVGLGNASVYENGITLHHVYGIPYIPGSSLKGMLRTFMINELYGYEKQSETNALKNGIFRSIFGCPEQSADNGAKGNIQFFDAFPIDSVEVEPDIINNHYQSYYDGDTPPADWINPNPVFFLTVKGGSFRFNLGVKEIQNKPMKDFSDDYQLFLEKTETKLSENATLIEVTEAWLKTALAFHGIGAKTAVGYGRMTGDS